MPFIFFLLILFSFNLYSNENLTHDTVEQVVVIGVRPGPELWKISNGENVLWILGTLSPLPKKMVWHSQLVEARLEDSQALLLPAYATAEMGFFKKLSLVSSVIGIQKNPNGKKLKDIIPEDLYARWVILKKKYVGNNRGIEKIRPIFAAQELFQKAVKKIGLVFDAGIEKRIRKIAKKNKLEFITPKVTLDIKKPKAAIKKFKKSEMNDLDCFATTLDRLEVDIKAMRQRANAWAYGDIAKIKALKYPDQNKSCGNAFLNTDVAQDTGITELPERLRNAWLEAAKKSLSKNKSTFAILPISILLKSNGYLDFLAAQGYTIEVPK